MSKETTYEEEEQKTQAQEEVEEKEEEDGGEEQTPEFSAAARNDDAETKNIAKSVFNKMFSVKNEEAKQKGEVESSIIQDGEGNVPFTSQGSQQILTVLPADLNVPYNIELRNRDGKIKNQIVNRRGSFKSRVNLEKGDYMVTIKSQTGSIPFSVKVE